jgi:hypothetical protein
MSKFRQLKTQAGNFVKWDTPKTVKGRLVAFQPGEYKGKPTVTVILAQADGTQIKVPGSSGLESSGLYNEQPGVIVELVFKGKIALKGGQTYNDIDVFVDSPEPEPRPTAAPGAKTTTTVPAFVAPAGTTTASDYDVLIAKLQLSNPRGAAAMATALEGLYPDLEVRTQKLRATLKEQGIA